MVRSADVSGRSPVREESAVAIKADSFCPRARAISNRTSQNSSSRATLVRCPAIEKLRLIKYVRRTLNAGDRIIASDHTPFLTGIRDHIPAAVRGQRKHALAKQAADAAMP